MVKNLQLLIIFIATIASTIACKQKIKKTENFISIVSIIKKEVADIDTSLYSIMKVVLTDSLHSDTTFIPREKFTEAAKDFLDIPDLSEPKVASRYKKEPPLMEEMMNRVIITYLPVNPEKEEVKRQELLATPILGEDARINNIIILREINNRDSFLQKKMLWQVGKSFQVVTTSQKPGKPERSTTTKVTWNEDSNQ
jgi:hypothetical protein